MPTYKNISSKPITLGCHDIKPGEEHRTTDLIDPLPAGIRKIDELPLHNTIVFADIVKGSKNLNIPQGITRFSIHYFAETGTPVIYDHDKSNTPPLRLYAGARWNKRYYERVMDKIIIENDGGILWVIIEKV